MIMYPLATVEQIERISAGNFPVRPARTIGPERRMGWAAAIGSVYETRNGQLVVITQYSVKLTHDLEAKFTKTIENEHRRIAAELVATLPLKDQIRAAWPQLWYDEQGNYQQGIWPGNLEFPALANTKGEHPYDLMHFRSPNL